MKSSWKNKNGEIELLRFLFAVIVVLRHGVKLIVFDDPGLFNRASLAVEFFLIVSGYLMVSSCIRNIRDQKEDYSLGKDTGSFISHKFKALMPEFFLAWVISFFIFHIGTASSLSEWFHDLTTWFFELLPLSMAGLTGGEFHMAAWYISAMLLALLILYPICRKNFDLFTRVIAPLLAIFIVGIYAVSFGTTLGPTIPIGTITFRGMPRAIAMISLGAAIWPGAQYLSRLEFTKAGKTILSIITVLCLAFSFVCIIFSRSTKYDIICVFTLALPTLLIFSRQTLLSHVFDNKFCCFLGRYSLLIYLCHSEWSKAIIRVYRQLADKPGISFQGGKTDTIIMFLIYIGLTLLTVAVVRLISVILIKNKNRILGVFVR